MKKLASLSIFFPFLNDEGTVARQIEVAFNTAKDFADDIEVIAIHGGNSRDNTRKKLREMKKKFPQLIVINKEDNCEGYAVIKHGFKQATKEWIFYTDGDAQYHLEEDLPKLIEKMHATGADIINGYKKIRRDDTIRIILGKLYSKISRRLFGLPIRDTDCDFRLIRRSIASKITLESTDSSILPELIVKLNQVKAKFAEVAVCHYPREYGKSNYTPFSLLKEKVMGDLKLFMKIWLSKFKLPIKRIKK